MAYILGINAYHGDSAACIYKEGQLIAAIEEERLRRIKHWAGLPTEAVRFCLAEAGISFAQVAHVAISRDPRQKLWQKFKYAARRWRAYGQVLDRLTNLFKMGSLKQDLAAAMGFPVGEFKAQVHPVEHHRCHLASAYFASPFADSALLTVDGFGDFTSTMMAVGQQNRIQVLDSLGFPHSLGVFYTAFTQHLGFPHYGDEYKLMGLAPYGKPVFVDALNNVLKLRPNGFFELNLHYFNHVRQGVNMSWRAGSPQVGALLTAEAAGPFGPPRAADQPLTQAHLDLAASVQACSEEAIFHLANHLYKITGLPNLSLAGGVAQNSVANGKLLARTPFKKLYVPPAGHDAGTALGAALYVHCQVQGHPRPQPQAHSYFGARFTNEQVEGLLKRQQIEAKRYASQADLVDWVSQQLAQGAVVGWFQGRAEFGPRALGNRSILADPRRADAKDLLNRKIKHRESFRPFAPSILKEYADEYFEQAADTPFMERVLVVRPEKRAQIPAVTHLDGTGRLQTVDSSTNPRYHALIERFAKLTGIPILLNTSFNENEPIVNLPEEALACFLRTQMDILVLEDFVISR
jgi:carbamoyltransferase